MVSRSATDGYTLVEVLVALVLFSLIGLAGFTILDTVLRVKDIAEKRFERLEQIDFALLVFARDVLQSRPGTIELDSGVVSFQLFDGTAIGFSKEKGTFARKTGGGQLSQRLLQSVSEVQFRILDGANSWRNSWSSAHSVGQARAVELSVELQLLPQAAADHARIRKLVELPHEAGP